MKNTLPTHLVVSIAGKRSADSAKFSLNQERFCFQSNSSLPFPASSPFPNEKSNTITINSVIDLFCGVLLRVKK